MLAKRSKSASKGAKAAAAATAVKSMQSPEVAEPEQPPEVALAPEDDPIFPLGSLELWETHRVTVEAPSYEQIFQALRSTDEASLQDFVNVNRDLLEYRFMFQLTAQVLRASNTGDAAASADLRALLEKVVHWAQRFDAALFQAIVAAEGRLGQLLAKFVSAAGGKGDKPSTEDCVAAAGTEALEVFAFWLVVRSAALAWRRKLGVESVAALAQAKMTELLEIAATIEERQDLIEVSGIAPLPDLLAIGQDAAPAAAAARAKLAELAQGSAQDELLLARRVGCVSAACSRHNFEAYNPMTTQTAAIHDMLLWGEERAMEPQDIAAPASEATQSRLIQMANEADSNMPPELRQLFW